MKHSPEDLEKFIHQTLRALPARRAPHSLESRVRAAIAARAALPWWRQSFARWPLAARVAFFIGSAGVAKVALMAAVWVLAGFDGAQFTNANCLDCGQPADLTAWTAPSAEPPRL